MRILIIDDEASLLFAMHDYLTRDGFEVECALELEEAEALLDNLSFDAVITDVRLTPMRDTHGLRVPALVRQRGLTIPVIVVTAHATPEIVDEARRRGAELVLSKPASLPALAASLRSLSETAPCF